MQINLKQLAMQSLVLLALLAGALFLPAGRLAWTMGWVYLVLFFGFFLGINAWLFRHNPGLLRERMSLSRPDQKGWDKVIFPLLLIFPFAWLALISLDAARFWSRWAGVALALIGFALLDLLSKSWAQVTLGKSWSDTPRMMKGQTLIISGPYQFIRHPIYTAFILILGSTLLISSNWLIGLAWLGMTALEVISRIGFEESLMLEYFGDQYRDYMKKTGQLIPRLIQ